MTSTMDRSGHTLEECQKEVDTWIRMHPEGYWSPTQMYTRLGTEVGELGKEILQEFGPLKKKADEKPSSIKEECGDILFTLICILNSQKMSLEEAFQIAMGKCYGRDKDRFKKRAAPCAHEWLVDGDRDVCKKCGTRSHPVI